MSRIGIAKFINHFKRNYGPKLFSFKLLANLSILWNFYPCRTEFSWFLCKIIVFNKCENALSNKQQPKTQHNKGKVFQLRKKHD